MILIISGIHDSSTNEVINWLNFYEISYKRITENSIVQFEYLSILEDDFVFSIDDIPINLSDISACFIRRGDFEFSIDIPKSENKNVNYYIDYHFKNDLADLKNHFLNRIRSTVFTLGDIKYRRLNKLEVLFAAKQSGLNIPKSYVLKNSEQINNLTIDWISKGISETLDIRPSEDSNGYFSYTSQGIQNTSDSFWPTLIQQKIEKSFELRIFFIEQKFYASSIMSQSHSATALDFRDDEDVNVLIQPYEVPSELKDKLVDLTSKLGLNIGSIDIMVDTEGEYYFLEINPMGQFGHYGKSVNYKLEKIIAERLMLEI